MILRDTQATFSGGEFTPALYGRTDLAKYKTGVRAGRNVNTLPQGGFRNRPGTFYVASAGDSSKAIRLISFIASSTSAYIIELGNFYARFYSADAQIPAASVAAWVTLTPYIVGNFVTNSGTTYYCLVAHTAGTFATDLAAGKWVAQTAYQIVTPWAAADLFKIKFAQSADVMYFTHPTYAPQQLTFTSAASWAIAPCAFVNGPFMVQNSTVASTITASALSGSVTLTAAIAQFNAGHVGALYELIATVPGQTTTPSITTSVTNWIPTGSTWAAAITGTWSGTILIQTSPDNVTWATVATVTSNSTPSGSTGFTQGYIRAIINSALAFSGSATVALTGDGNSSAATAVSALNSTVGYPPGIPCGSNATTTITGVWVADIKLQKSTDGGLTWSDLATYTVNQAATVQATGSTACLIRALVSAYTSGTATVTVDGTAANVPTLSFTVSTANQSQAIQCGSTWQIITNGTWTGKLRVEVSTDQGANWTLVRTLSSGSTNANYDTSGDTGFSQCLIRVSSDPTVAFTGTAVVDLTSNTFDWVGVVKITVVTDSQHVTATVQALSNTSNTGLANLSATYQWSEGSFSTYRGFPTCVTFYQDRLALASTPAEPNTVWHSKTASYLDYGTSSPLLDTDGFSVVLASRQLNSVNFLIPMPQALIAGSNDMAFGLSPGPSGIYSATSIQQTPMDHRGSFNLDPVVVGNEIILVQQMGTVVRNLIFQLAVNGFMGDNISVASQHLFTGYSIVQMAYQQEPDSIVWAVRSDGVLLSCTYDRSQEMNAWTRHDTFAVKTGDAFASGLFESVACIPNATLGINEIWFVVNRNGVRCIEALKPRDQGTVPSAQWFVDAGLQYSGAAASVITGLSHLNGYTVAVYADGFVVANGVNDAVPIVVASGQITLPNSMTAAKVLVGIPIVWDVGLLDMDTPNKGGTLQGNRVKQVRLNVRCLNSRGGYVSTADPASNTGLLDVNGNSFDAFFDVMQRDPDTNFDTALPLVSDIINSTPPSGYDYSSHVCIRGIDPLPFTLLDVISDVVPGGS